MKISFHYFTYFLLLTIFKSFLSLSNKDNYELQKTISDYNISDNYINTIDLKAGENITLNVSYTYGKDLFLSIKTLNDKSFNILCNDIEILNKNDTKELINRINKNNFHEIQLFFIDISSKEANTIEIINIVDEDKNQYNLIEKNNTNYTISNYNFVYYKKENEIKNYTKVVIKFNEEIQALIYYSHMRLSSKDENYIPRVFNFDDSMYIKEKIKGKEKIIEINTEPQGNKTFNNISFIFSLNPDSNVNEYYVTIFTKEEEKGKENGKEKGEEKEEIMNEFLIGSIVLALIFAVITFFLIRRKKNINDKNIDDDFYKEENKEEDEKN